MTDTISLHHEYSMLPQQHIRANIHPVLAYLNTLAASGQRTQRVALDKAAAVMSAGTRDHMSFPWSQLRYEHVATLRTRLQEENLKFTYINKILAAVRGVASECWKLELKNARGQLLMQDSDLMRIREVKNVKGQALLAGRCLSMTELRSIGEACQDGSLRGIRDAALFALLAGAGLRRGEPVSIDLSDYNAVDGSVVIRGGKGNKDRTAWIVDNNKRFVDKWLEFRPAVDGPLILPLAKGGVFCMREMTHENVYKIVMRRAELAGVECSVHDLRRTFATLSIDQGVNIAALQSQLGHASAAQTLLYDRSGEEQKRKMAHMMSLSLGGT